MPALESTPERTQVVAALLRRQDRVLLCHRSPTRRWYPDVWDLAGGHVEPAESPSMALVRELREELGIAIGEPSGQPINVVRTHDVDMRVWLVEEWAGTPVNSAPDEHDAIAWFGLSRLYELRLAHESYLPMISEVLATPPHTRPAAKDR